MAAAGCMVLGFRVLAPALACEAKQAHAAQGEVVSMAAAGCMAIGSRKPNTSTFYTCCLVPTLACDEKQTCAAQEAVVGVAAAGHSLAVDQAGALWTWGRNDSAGGGGGGGSEPLAASGQLGWPRDGPATLPCQAQLSTGLCVGCAFLEALQSCREAM